MSGDQPSYRSRLLLLAGGMKGGAMQIRELVDYPGVTVTSTLGQKGEHWVRSVEYGGRTFNNVRDAIETWTAEGNDLV